MTAPDGFEEWFFGPEMLHVKDEYKHAFSREYKLHKKTWNAAKADIKWPEKKLVNKGDSPTNRRAIGFNEAIDEMKKMNGVGGNNE